VVYVSTAGIFSGEKERYHDFDAADPLNVYGRTKYQGELVTRMMCGKFFIFRAGWMMGGGVRKDKKFVGKIFRQMAAGAKKLFVVDDKVGNPTYTVDFADSLFSVAGSELYGHYNMACSGSASRHEVAVEFVRNLGLEDRVAIEVVDSAYFAAEYFAPRPRSERLVNLKLAARGMMRMRDWKTCLAEYAEVFRRQP
jgi:dTDP-4-dehydrorhamnose reductase